MAIKFKQTWSNYEKNRDLIAVGAYRKGADATIDYAISKFPKLQQYMQQGAKDKATLVDSKQQLFGLVGEEKVG